MAKLFIVIGLAFDVAGVALVWIFGLPRKDLDREGRSHYLLEQTDEAEKQEAARYDRLSAVGLGSIIVGFVLQIAGTLLG